MKTATRNHAAAALLFLPLAGAFLVAQPAHAQHYRAAVAQQVPSIERFVLNTHGRIEPGKELRFRLRGVPGAEAWVDIPGVISGIALAETRPGVYEADYTVRRRDDPSAFERATATLRVGNQLVVARVDVRGDETPRDDQPPRIVDVTPGDGVRVSERGGVHLFARLGDNNSGVDPASVRLRVDGRDVTSATQITVDELHFRDFLREGRHTAEIEVRDRAGNATRKAWSFEVVRAEDTGSRDQQPPRIVDVTPGDGARVTDRGSVHVAARLGDNSSGVDPASVRLRVDGRDVTGAAQITAEELHFRDDLRDGRHTAEIELRDRAGNVTRKAWSFEVARGQDPGRRDEQPQVRRDEQPPRIFEETPADGIRVYESAHLRLAVRFADEGGGVDPATVRVRLDGRDVTSSTQVSGDEMRVQEDLRLGRHTAEVEVRDRAGNASRKAWSFEVVR